MKRAGSWSRLAAMKTPCTRPMFSSSSWACAKAKFSGSPGSGSISRRPSCTSASSSSASPASSSVVEVKTESSEAPAAAARAVRHCAEAPQRTTGTPTVNVQAMRGSRPDWSSPPVMARRSSPATSIAASTAGSPRRVCPRSPGIAPGRHAVHCWRRSTCTRVWPCRSFGTARSPSRWRSTPKYPRLLPAKRSASWGSGWTGPRHWPLLHFAAAPRSKTAGPVSEPASELGAPLRNRTVDLLLTMETLCRLS